MIDMGERHNPTEVLAGEPTPAGERVSEPLHGGWGGRPLHCYPVVTTGSSELAHTQRQEQHQHLQAPVGPTAGSRQQIRPRAGPPPPFRPPPPPFRPPNVIPNPSALVNPPSQPQALFAPTAAQTTLPPPSSSIAAAATHARALETIATLRGERDIARHETAQALAATAAMRDESRRAEAAAAAVAAAASHTHAALDELRARLASATQESTLQQYHHEQELQRLARPAESNDAREAMWKVELSRLSNRVAELEVELEMLQERCEELEAERNERADDDEHEPEGKDKSTHDDVDGLSTTTAAAAAYRAGSRAADLSPYSGGNVCASTPRTFIYSADDQLRYHEAIAVEKEDSFDFEESPTTTPPAGFRLPGSGKKVSIDDAFDAAFAL